VTDKKQEEMFPIAQVSVTVYLVTYDEDPASHLKFLLRDRNKDTQNGETCQANGRVCLYHT
jgi:hypothetical protein